MTTPVGASGLSTVADPRDGAATVRMTASGLAVVTDPRDGSSSVGKGVQTPAAPPALSLVATYTASRTFASRSTAAYSLGPFTPAAGELLIIHAFPEVTDTSGALTWTQQLFYSPWNGPQTIWSAPVVSSPGAITVSYHGHAGSQMWGAAVLERWSGAKLAASPATGGNFTNTPVSPGTWSDDTSMTTVQAGSVVSWASFYFATASGWSDFTPAYVATSGTVTDLFDFNDPSVSTGNQRQYSFAWQTAPNAGAQWWGVTNLPGGGVEPQFAGIEIQAA